MLLMVTRNRQKPFRFLDIPDDNTRVCSEPSIAHKKKVKWRRIRRRRIDDSTVDVYYKTETGMMSFLGSLIQNNDALWECNKMPNRYWASQEEAIEGLFETFAHE